MVYFCPSDKQTKKGTRDLIAMCSIHHSNKAYISGQKARRNYCMPHISKHVQNHFDHHSVHWMLNAFSCLSLTPCLRSFSPVPYNLIHLSCLLFYPPVKWRRYFWLIAVESHNNLFKRVRSIIGILNTPEATVGHIRWMGIEEGKSEECESPAPSML